MLHKLEYAQLCDTFAEFGPNARYAFDRSQDGLDHLRDAVDSDCKSFARLDWYEQARVFKLRGNVELEYIVPVGPDPEDKSPMIASVPSRGIALKLVKAMNARSYRNAREVFAGLASRVGAGWLLDVFDSLERKDVVFLRSWRAFSATRSFVMSPAYLNFNAEGCSQMVSDWTMGDEIDVPYYINIVICIANFLLPYSAASNGFSTTIMNLNLVQLGNHLTSSFGQR